ncbi:MAG: hypothetical protein NE327_06285 [Lentisphaeraceae bacterium]|nr:hypothetical protein [Lentisphaeraceae bacterium]
MLKTKIKNTKKLPPIVRGEKFTFKGRIFTFLEEKKQKTEKKGIVLYFCRCINSRGLIETVKSKANELQRLI